MLNVLYAAFLLSGCAGLIYEAVWPRYIKLFVGHGAYAQVVVLAVFLGGMSIGAVLAGRFCKRIKNPILIYAAVELVVGVVGLAFHHIYVGATACAYETVFPVLSGTALVSAAKWGIAVSLILPQSILMGSTFPLMSSGVVRWRGTQTAGNSLAVLYFTNSLGGALGVLLAGFLLIPLAGLPGTSMSAGFINIIVALTVYLVERLKNTGRESASIIQPAKVEASEKLSLHESRMWRAILLVSFGTAVASFAYEIAWIRMLSLVLGSSTHVFELMLSAFILGLALGGYAIRKRLDSLTSPEASLGVVQCLMGLTALLTVPLYLGTFDVVAWLMEVFSRTAEGYVGFTLSRYALCLVVMFPPTFMAGMVLPLLTKIGMDVARSEKAIGYIYGVNTFGCIAGVLFGALILLPTIGLRDLMVVASALDMALGIYILTLAAFRQKTGGRRMLGWVTVSVGTCGLVFAAVDFDPILLSSGVFRFGNRSESSDKSAALFHEDGRTATITVVQHAPDSPRSFLTLKSNGKPDASLRADWLEAAKNGGAMNRSTLDTDEATMTLLGLIALSHIPYAEQGAVIGLGTGITTHFLLGSPSLQELETIEIEPAVIRSARLFYPVNRRVFDDPRSVLLVDDAKAHFSASRKTYDLIISEPSNPWVSGVASLFTFEFYQRVKSHLADDGIFAQWLQLYEISDDLVLSVLKALYDTFPSFQIYQAGPLDIVVVAGKQADLPKADWSIFDWPALKEDFRFFAPFTADILSSLSLFSRSDLEPLVAYYPERNSDYFPFLDTGSEKARYFRSTSGFVSYYQSQPADILAILNARKRLFLPPTVSPVPSSGRLGALQMRQAVSDEFRSHRQGRFVGDGYAADTDAPARLGHLLRTDRPPHSWPLWL